MKYIPYLLVVVVLALVAYIACGLGRWKKSFIDNDLVAYTYFSSDNIQYIQLRNKDDIASFRLITDGIERDAAGIANIVKSYNATIGAQRHSDANQISDEDFIVTFNGQGKVDWLGFFPRNGMTCRLRGVTLSFSDVEDFTISGMASKLAVDRDKIKSLYCPAWEH